MTYSNGSAIAVGQPGKPKNVKEWGGKRRNSLNQYGDKQLFMVEGSCGKCEKSWKCPCENQSYSCSVRFEMSYYAEIHSMACICIRRCNFAISAAKRHTQQNHSVRSGDQPIGSHASSGPSFRVGVTRHGALALFYWRATLATSQFHQQAAAVFSGRLIAKR